MAMELSKTQIDRLGDRLRKGTISEADLRLLDSYRRSFSEAYEVVVETIRRELAVEPTGRRAKTITSISDKLRRESIRLSQIQDIAGCRLIVPDIAGQEFVVQSLKNLFEHTNVIDRREKPSHGYRAVHVVVTHGGKMIEVQVRTSLQQLWAELSEKMSDILDPAIKYGGGDQSMLINLTYLSSTIAGVEFAETELPRVQEGLASKGVLTEDVLDGIGKVQENLGSLRQQVTESLRAIIKLIEETKGENNGISD